MNAQIDDALLQCFQMHFDGIAMCHRRVDVHIEVVLQHGWLTTHHGILIRPLLILLLRLLHEIDTNEDNHHGQDKGDDES